MDVLGVAGVDAASREAKYRWAAATAMATNLARVEEAATARGAAATARAEEAATAGGAAATGAGCFFGVSKTTGGGWIGVVHVHTLERALLPHHLQQKARLRTLSFTTQVEAARAVDRCAG